MAMLPEMGDTRVKPISLHRPWVFCSSSLSYVQAVGPKLFRNCSFIQLLCHTITLPPLNCFFAYHLFTLSLIINKFKLSWGSPTCRPLSLGGKAVLHVVCRGHSEMGHLHELASSRHTPPTLDNLLHPVQRTPNATSFLTQFYREWQTTCDAPTGEPP